MASKHFATFIDELEARTEIEDALKRFARAVDRQDWKLARTLYHDGAFDDHGFFKGPPDAFLAHITKTHVHQDHSMHFNTNVMIEFTAADKAFVETYVLVLQRFFRMSTDEATQVMLHVHQRGVGVCGVFSYEVAETKVTQVMDFARQNQHPLQCTLEKA